MNRLKLTVASILGLLMLVFVAQNTEVVDIRFIVWRFSMSRVLLVLLTLLVGFVLGFIASRVIDTSHASNRRTSAPPRTNR